MDRATDIISPTGKNCLLDTGNGHQVKLYYTLAVHEGLKGMGRSQVIVGASSSVCSWTDTPSDTTPICIYHRYIATALAQVNAMKGRGGIKTRELFREM